MSPLAVYKRMPRRLPLSLGFKRYSMYFDGVDDYVETVLSLLEHGEEFTVEMLMCPRRRTAEDVGYREIVGCSSWRRYGWSIGDATWSKYMHFYVFWPDNLTCARIPYYPDYLNRWMHVVARFSVPKGIQDLRVNYDELVGSTTPEDISLV